MLIILALEVDKMQIFILHNFSIFSLGIEQQKLLLY